jgi:hypothetical protein
LSIAALATNSAMIAMTANPTTSAMGRAGPSSHLESNAGSTTMAPRAKASVGMDNIDGDRVLAKTAEAGCVRHTIIRLDRGAAKVAK